MMRAHLYIPGISSESELSRVHSSDNWPSHI